MGWLNNIFSFIWDTLLQEFIAVVFGVLFVQFVQRWWETWRYGKWKIVITSSAEELVRRDISPSKVKDILAETADMAVFVKGVASPYVWINCDLLTEGKERGLFSEDRVRRCLTVDVDKNPPRRSPERLQEGHS